MSNLLKRPVAVFDPAKGLLHNEHFQVAYVTNDLDRTCEIFQQRFGIAEFGGLEGEMPSGGYIKIKLAWVGSTMYELIFCEGPGTDMYNSRLPANDFGLHFHHLGFLVHNEACWEALHRVIAQGGWEIQQTNNAEGFMNHTYIYVPEVGHHFEYIFPEQAGIDFFESMPAS